MLTKAQSQVKYWIPNLIVVIVVTGCASAPPPYEEAFSESEEVQGSVGSIPASMEITWIATLEALSRQGFLIQQIDAKNRIMQASREMQDKEDKDFSYTVNATLTFIPLADQITKVMVAANETTEFHKKEYRWWKLFWIIPLIPVGTDYTTVIVNRNTVRSSQFYLGFFDTLEKYIMIKKNPAQPDPAL